MRLRLLLGATLILLAMATVTTPAIAAGPGPMPPSPTTCFLVPEPCAGGDSNGNPLGPGWASLTGPGAVRVGETKSYTYTGLTSRDWGFWPGGIARPEDLTIRWSWGYGPNTDVRYQLVGCGLHLASVDSVCQFTFGTPTYLWRRQADGTFAKSATGSGWTHVSVYSVMEDLFHGYSEASMWVAVLREGERIISGAATGLDGDPEKGVTVTAIDGAGHSYTAQTRVDGKYELIVPGNTYTVNASAGNGEVFTPKDPQVDVSSSDGTRNFQAGCPSGPPIPSPLGSPPPGGPGPAPSGTSPDPAWRSVSGATTSYVCPAVEWELPARIDTFTTPDSLPEAQARYYPPSWRVRFKLWNVAEDKRFCDDTKYSYEWYVQPVVGGTAWKEPTTGCLLDVNVPKLGEYRVWAKESKRVEGGGLESTGRVHYRRIVVQDLLFVAVGDSNSSGEGNPPFFDNRCNRSTKAYQFQTARAIEKADPHTSVSLVFVGCSGAETRHLWKEPFRGVRPIGNQTVAPQFKQVRFFLTPPGMVEKNRRKIHAVLMSIGVNDVLFAPNLVICLADPACNEPTAQITVVPKDGDLGLHSGIHLRPGANPISGALTLMGQFQRRITQLRLNYEAVDNHLSMMGPMQKKRIHQTQYPDFTTGNSRERCTSDSTFSSNGWRFFHEAGTMLNNEALATGKRFGWLPVTGISTVFVGHGYCTSSGNRWMVQLTSGMSTPVTDYEHGGVVPFSVNLQGAFHPNGIGHQAAADVTAKQVCSTLYGEPTCTSMGFPRP